MPVLETRSTNQGEKVGAPRWISCPSGLAEVKVGTFHTRSSCTPVSPQHLHRDSRPPCQWYMWKGKTAPKSLQTVHGQWYSYYIHWRSQGQAYSLVHLMLFLLSCPLWSVCSPGIWGCGYHRLLQIRFKELSSRYWTYWLMHLNKLSNIIGTKGGFIVNKIKFPRKLVWEGVSFQNASTTLSSRSELWLDVADAISPYSKKTLPRKTLFFLKYLKYSIQSHY